MKTPFRRQMRQAIPDHATDWTPLGGWAALWPTHAGPWMIREYPGLIVTIDGPGITINLTGDRATADTALALLRLAGALAPEICSDKAGAHGPHDYRHPDDGELRDCPGTPGREAAR